MRVIMDERDLWIEEFTHEFLKYVRPCNATQEQLESWIRQEAEYAYFNRDEPSCPREAALMTLDAIQLG